VMVAADAKQKVSCRREGAGRDRGALRTAAKMRFQPPEHDPTRDAPTTRSRENTLMQAAAEPQTQ
jgi:hypothetical protein